MKQTTIDEVKKVFDSVPIGTEFTTAEINHRIKNYLDENNFQPTDYCYNLTNKGINIERNLKEQKCLFEYKCRNKFIYRGCEYIFTGELMHRPKGGKVCSVGKIIQNIVYIDKN